MTETKKSQWNSNFAFMMAMIGSAVGLGNIWRFPKVLYTNGGGSFMIPYIVSLFLLGISFVLVEYAVGYRFKRSLARILFTISKKLEPVAWFILFTVFLITTYYVCVVGWDLIYIFLSFTKAWGANPDVFFTQNVLHSTESMSGLLTIVPTVLVSVIAIWFITWFIIKRDLNDGIGAVSKVLIPLLCAIVVIIVAFALTLPGASVGYTQIFTPDWSALGNLDVWLAAFGQIVFSLSLGMAIAMTYASYLPEGSKLVDNAIIVAFSNSGFEVFNSIGTFSILGFMAVTSAIPFDDLVTSGSGLAFVVFPKVFNIMGDAAYIIGPLFFICILFAGITSIIALLEGFCYSISEKFLIERKKTATVVCIVGCLISAIFATAAGSTILDIADAFLNNFALLFAVFLECIIFGWIYKFDNLIETLNEHSRIKVGKTWKTVIKYILPICIAGLWLQGVWTTISSNNELSSTVMLVLTAIVIVVPIILAKLPAINKDYYNVEN